MAAAVKEKYLKRKELKTTIKAIEEKMLRECDFSAAGEEIRVKLLSAGESQEGFCQISLSPAKRCGCTPTRSSSFSTCRKLHAAQEQRGRINNIDQSEMRSHASDAAPVTDSHAWKAEILLKDSSLE